jgi:tetratricopeptide (TPR) repeat protein
MLITAPLFAIGWHLIAITKGWDSMLNLMIAMACFVVIGVILAPPLARLISEPAGSFFYSEKPYVQPQTLYDLPESLREKGRYAEAISEYQKIAGKYHEDTKPYIEMMDIAMVDLKDRELAAAIFNRGLSSLQNKDDQDVLKIAHATVTSEFSMHHQR